MEPKLKNISKSYHKFVNDQVLTADKLNNVITHFDEQQRLSRVFLSGVGIVCGFTVRFDDSIFIGPGIGVTSDGDLLQFRETGITNSTEKLANSEIEFSHCRSFVDANAQYSCFQTDEEESVMEMWELLPKTEQSLLSNTEDIQEVGNIDLSNKVVVLYLDSYAYKGDLCTAIDCDSQGEEQVAKLRVLLVSEYNAQILAVNDPVFKWHNIAEKYTALPEIKAMRVAVQSTSNIDELRERFHSAIPADLLAKLKNGFATIFEIFGASSISTKINELLLFTPDAFKQFNDFQYRYDLLSDLIETYNEIKSLLLQINVECAPSVDAFPKHLLLGKVQPETEFHEFRHRSYKSPLSKTEVFNRAKVESLIQRVQKLLSRFKVRQFTKVEEIKILPSKNTNVVLGEKTIPFYYDLSQSFLKTWSFERSLNFNEKYNLCYHSQLLASDTEVQEPLLFISNDTDFYRIEGHLGLNAKESVDEISSDIQRFGLNFDVKVLELDVTKKSFSDFVKNHPGLVHKSGVPKGGTFILLANDKKVVADFCLPYKVVEQKTADCCSLMECSYPWISSLKYLNNLARSISGTQSRTKFMPENYVLQVIEYKINGQAIIDNSTTVSVPLQKIFKQRMHAVTDALNKRFSKGVVFDFNESQKRFLIIRAKEDRYTIRLRDITYKHSGAIYTFSNNGMFRNDEVFRADAMRCRDLKAYKPEFYAELQRTIAPEHKDDDYGKFYKKWAEWYRLRDKLVRNGHIEELELTRMITKVSELPSEVRTRLRSLKNDLSEVSEEGLSFKLDGDWVTGEWVNKDMLDYYRDNKAKEDDDIVEFIKLRKFLHGETGITKLSVYVTNNAYSEAFNPLIKEYSNFADIYFGTPSGANAITI